MTDKSSEPPNRSGMIDRVNRMLLVCGFLLIACAVPAGVTSGIQMYLSQNDSLAAMMFSVATALTTVTIGAALLWSAMMLARR